MLDHSLSQVLVKRPMVPPGARRDKQPGAMRQFLVTYLVGNTLSLFLIHLLIQLRAETSVLFPVEYNFWCLRRSVKLLGFHLEVAP